MTAAGLPCQQNINPKAPACLWHSKTPKQRSLLATKGSIAAKMMRALPASYQVKPFDSVESIISWAHDMADKCLKEDIDPRRTSEARGFAQLALSAIQSRTQQQMVDALLRLEHGGAAMMLMAKFQQGMSGGQRRPLPGRTVNPVESPPSEEVVS